MAKERDLWIIPLICPECGDRLSADRGSTLFPCRKCRLLWEPEEGSLARREIHVLSGEGSIHVPFWLFPFRIEAKDATVATLSEYLRMCGTITTPEPERQGMPPVVFVPACAGMAPHLMLRAGRLLTHRSPLLSPARPNTFPDHRLMAIGVRERDAALMARTIVLATMPEERRQSLPFLQACTITVGRGRLCAIPFDERGERLFHAEWMLEI